jgi:hypothetical protein
MLDVSARAGEGTSGNNEASFVWKWCIKVGCDDILGSFALDSTEQGMKIVFSHTVFVSGV